MKRKVLITGANGFLGYHLIVAGRNSGLEVHAGVREGSNVAHLGETDVQVVPIPYGSEDGILHVLERGSYDAVIHAAALIKAKTEVEFRLVNVEYALNMAKAAVRAGSIERFVFISSLAAIGPLAYGDGLITEETQPAPVTAYGRSKLTAERLLRQVEGLPLTIIRPTAVYGPRERELLVLFRTLAKGVDAYVGRKPQLLSFVHAVDLAECIVAASGHDRASGHAAYNLSDGNVYGRYEIADILRQVTGKRSVRVHLPVGLVRAAAHLMAFCSRRAATVPVLYPERIGELTAANWACSIDKAKHELGYSPRYRLSDGLKLTMDWYKENKWI